MKFAVVVFPGSNCDHDAYHAAQHVLGQEAEFVWHKETSLKGADVVILPGGFSHGDYLRTGAIARFSPVMATVADFARHGGPVLGICNGFQILLEAGLLPGAMLRNRDLKFHCEHVRVRVEQTDTPFTSRALAGQILRIPIAHGEGNYYAEPDVIHRLEHDKRIVFRYCDAAGRTTAESNPNGSLANIAGICNDERNVVGLMPHPERACESALGSADGLVLFDSVIASLEADGSPASRVMASETFMSTPDPALLERHGLTVDEYEHIVRSLGREPTLTELGIFSVMWSEHCSYKSSRIHLKKLPTRGPRVVQGPGENAGAVDIGDGYAAVFKIESHNHPSFIEPYQGAATGVGGIIRDIFTMGARPIALLNSLRFGPMDGPDGARTRRIVEGVVAGIAGYGNSIGIPTIGGEIAFEPTYAGNPLVNVLCLGIARSDALVKGTAGGVGNPVYYVGASTGRDGIHGATMASAEFDEKSSEKRPAVQVGDPFMEKLLLEACLELMKTDALVGVQDMGAAGLTCSTCEMGARGGDGCRDRREPRPAARDRDDALRDHAVRVAGTHAARREAWPGGRSRGHLREVGPSCRKHRHRDRRRSDAREGSRSGCRRDSQHGVGRRGTHLRSSDDAARLSGGRAEPAISGVFRQHRRQSRRCSRCCRRRPSPASDGCTANTTTWSARTRSFWPAWAPASFE